VDEAHAVAIAGGAERREYDPHRIRASQRRQPRRESHGDEQRLLALLLFANRVCDIGLLALPLAAMRTEIELELSLLATSAPSFQVIERSGVAFGFVETTET
jgi:hypothetical protein